MSEKQCSGLVFTFVNGMVPCKGKPTSLINGKRWCRKCADKHKRNKVIDADIAAEALKAARQSARDAVVKAAKKIQWLMPHADASPLQFDPNLIALRDALDALAKVEDGT